MCQSSSAALPGINCQKYGCNFSSSALFQFNACPAEEHLCRVLTHSCVHSCVQGQHHLVPGGKVVSQVAGGSEPPDVIPLCHLCLSWAMAVSSSTDQWHFTNWHTPMGITSTLAASWRRHLFWAFLVALILEMGTMAAWFGCLIMLQLLLFMSKPASKKLKSSTAPPLKKVREDSTVFWLDFLGLEKDSGLYIWHDQVQFIKTGEKFSESSIIKGLHYRFKGWIIVLRDSIW